MFNTWCQKYYGIIIGLETPSHLDIERGQWQEWIRSYEIYAIAAGIAEKDEKIQCCVFLHVAGPQAQKLKDTMTFVPDEIDKIEPLKKKFKEFSEGKKNITVIRYQFNSHNKKKTNHLTLTLQSSETK